VRRAADEVDEDDDFGMSFCRPFASAREQLRQAQPAEAEAADLKESAADRRWAEDIEVLRTETGGSEGRRTSGDE